MVNSGKISWDEVCSPTSGTYFLYFPSHLTWKSADTEYFEAWKCHVNVVVSWIKLWIQRCGGGGGWKLLSNNKIVAPFVDKIIKLTVISKPNLSDFSTRLLALSSWWEMILVIKDLWRQTRGQREGHSEPGSVVSGLGTGIGWGKDSREWNEEQLFSKHVSGLLPLPPGMPRIWVQWYIGVLTGSWLKFLGTSWAVC